MLNCGNFRLLAIRVFCTTNGYLRFWVDASNRCINDDRIYSAWISIRLLVFSDPLERLQIEEPSSDF